MSGFPRGEASACGSGRRSSAALVAHGGAVSYVWTPCPPADIDVPHRFVSPSFAHWLGSDAWTLHRLGVSSWLPDLAARRPDCCRHWPDPGRGAWLPPATVKGWSKKRSCACDFTFAFRRCCSAILLTAIYGPGVVNAIVAIGISNVPVFARLTRGTANPVWPGLFAGGAGLGARGLAITWTTCCRISRRADRAGDDPVRAGDPRGGRAVLPRAGHAAAAAVLGPDAERRADLALQGAAAGRVSGAAIALACSASTCLATACATRSTPRLKARS